MLDSWASQNPIKSFFFWRYCCFKLFLKLCDDDVLEQYIKFDTWAIIRLSLIVLFLTHAHKKK